MKAVFMCFAASLCISVVLSCYSQKDCKEGYCCTGGITPWLRGSCKKMAEEGELCDPNPPSTSKYFLRCPCVEGLTCVSTTDVISNKSPLCVQQ